MSERDWTKCLTLVSNSRFNDQHKQGGPMWSLEKENFHSENEKVHMSSKIYEGNGYGLDVFKILRSVCCAWCVAKVPVHALQN